jgi:hypothetical protein
MFADAPDRVTFPVALSVPVTDAAPDRNLATSVEALYMYTPEPAIPPPAIFTSPPVPPLPAFSFPDTLRKPPRVVEPAPPPFIIIRDASAPSTVPATKTDAVVAESPNTTVVAPLIPVRLTAPVTVSVPVRVVAPEENSAMVDLVVVPIAVDWIVHLEPIAVSVQFSNAEEKKEAEIFPLYAVAP